MASAAENKAIIAKVLAEEGIPRVVAAALMGRINAESGFNPAAFNPNDPGGGSVGIFQWNRNRRTALEKFAISEGEDVNDVAVQARFLAAEVKGEIGTEGNNGRRLLESETVDAAVDAVMGLARPAGFTRSNPRGGLGFRKTRDTALELLNDGEGVLSISEFDSQATQGNQGNQEAATPLDSLLIGITQGLLDGPERQTAPDVHIQSDLLTRPSRSITNFLRTLPGVGLGSIRNG